MTLLDLILIGSVTTDAQAEKLAADLVDAWHEDQLKGELIDILRLTPREYQAWTTGGVSLLTIAQWHRYGAPPPLDESKLWFKLSGKPGHERVGYMEDRVRR
jgi:hypothetical protein